MPTYVYKNVETGEIQEHTMTIAEKEAFGDEYLDIDLEVDRVVGRYRRVFTPNPVHFKGSGFYSTSSKA